MTDPKGETEPTLVERWLQEQQAWQRTLLTYVDSMARNDEFLVNLGNAMRGSLLAGKPYPTAQPAAPNQPDDRLDQVLFALHALQGQLQDLAMSVEDIRRAVGAAPPAPAKSKVPRPRRTPRPSARPRKART